MIAEDGRTEDGGRGAGDADSVPEIRGAVGGETEKEEEGRTRDEEPEEPEEPEARGGQKYASAPLAVPTDALSVPSKSSLPLGYVAAGGDARRFAPRAGRDGDNSTVPAFGICRRRGETPARGGSSNLLLGRSRGRRGVRPRRRGRRRAIRTLARAADGSRAVRARGNVGERGVALGGRGTEDEPARVVHSTRGVRVHVPRRGAGRFAVRRARGVPSERSRARLVRDRVVFRDASPAVAAAASSALTVAGLSWFWHRPRFGGALLVAAAGMVWLAFAPKRREREAFETARREGGRDEDGDERGRRSRSGLQRAASMTRESRRRVHVR